MFSEFVANQIEKVGLPLEDMLAIPHGQFALAVVPKRAANSEAAQGNDAGASVDNVDEVVLAKGADFSVIVIVDAGDRRDDLLSLLKHQAQRMTERAFVFRERTIGDVAMTCVVPSTDSANDQPLMFASIDETVVIGGGADTTEDVIRQVAGTSRRPTLADHPPFVKLMSRCMGEEDTRPQATFFIDPAVVVQRVMRQSLTSAMVIPMVQQLGLQRLRGIAGSFYGGGEFFQDISHVHFGIDPPRDGVFGLLRPDDGSTEPPSWVPDDVTSYTTFKWRFDVALKNAESFIGTFTGGKTLDEAVVTPLENWTGLSVRDELLPAMTGRYVLVRRLAKPVLRNSLVSVHAVEFRDATVATNLIEKFRAKRVEWTLESFRGKNVYTLHQKSYGEDLDDFRPYEPTLFVIGNYLCFTTSRETAEQCIATQGGLRPALVDGFDYQQIAGELSGMMSGEKPFQVSFVRPADWIELAYEAFRREGPRAANDEDAGPFRKRLAELAVKHELPPFETLRKYFAPQGSYLYDEPGGVHWAAYTLNGEVVED